MIKVIKEKKEWCEELALFEHLDFYYTYDYHHLSKKEDEVAVLLKYVEGDSILVLPLLIRDIENTDYKDAISVYGYAGVLNKNITDDFNIENFHNEISTFFNENKIVSVFSRLHPFLENQELLLNGLGSITTPGKVVYIDLNDTIENQRAKFNRRLKTYLNKSRKSCTVINGNIEEHLKIFIDLYHGNMRRVDADDSYFFEDEYFFKLLSSTDYESELLLCLDNETQNIMGGAIFIKKDAIVQYHLSGLAKEDFDVDPIKLIIDEMRIKATKEGYKYLNLGGGRGSSEDSLFRFKSGFSKDFKDFKLWKYVVNEEVYKMLCREKLGEDYVHLEDMETGFFPAYRS